MTEKSGNRIQQKQRSAFSTRHSAVQASAEPSVCRHERSEGSAFHARDRIVRMMRTTLAALREIFDENGYARFLAQHGMTNSRESYALYLRETNLTRERRPRCC